jgi:DNA (cytosine-5)-methyltransferase 1
MMTETALPEFVTKPLTVQDPPRFTVVSTFAGCGGSSTGYVWAGGKVLLAVEWDANAVQTYQLNYPDTPIYHGDIAKLSVEEALRLTGLKPGELDIFDGSPPCQGFSTAGKRDFADDRNQLFREYVRLLRGLKPKVFVMENVSGMVKGKMKLIFVDILRELKASGYRVSARLLNAKYFGVPQSRERMIFVGVREDLGIEPTHPRAQTSIIPVMAVAPFEQLDYDTKGQFSEFNLNIRTKPFPSITKGNRHHFFVKVSGEYRKIHIAEAKLFQSFPQAYKFAGSDSVSWERIGNSVPPMLMYHVAAHIRDHVLAKTEAADG